MAETLSVVDAFTDEPFAGNPAAVAVVDRFPPDERMQRIAREMNLSETAFVVARRGGGHDLRWFTPEVEVDLCGHATLASAHVLGGSARFHTRSGVLDCIAAGDGSIEMDFPADPPAPVPTPAGLTGTGALFAGRGAFDLLVALPTAEEVRSFRPDQEAIAALDCRGVIVTAPGDRRDIDFVSRFFAPAVGVAEDPVTGSAHCTLAVYWSQKLGRDSLVGYQESARGGTVSVRVAGDRVVLGGRAVTVSEVRLLV